MRDTFSEWYPAGDEEIDAILKEGRIVLDANALLDIYRSTQLTRDEMFLVLENENIRNRLFLPFQAGREYHRNRLNVIHDTAQSFDDIKRECEKLLNPKGVLNSIRSLRPKESSRFLEGEVLRKVKEVVGEIAEIVADEKSRHSFDFNKFRHDDFIRDRLESIFADGGQIGEKPSLEAQREREEVVKKRLKADQPPGTADKDNDNGGLGDGLIWLEMIDLSKSSKAPILFVSGDQKLDWMPKVHGQRVGPNPVLLHEFRDQTGQTYHQVSWVRFVELAKDAFEIAVGDGTITELNESYKEQSKSPTQAHSKSLKSLIASQLASASAQELQEWVLRGISPELNSAFINGLSPAVKEDLANIGLGKALRDRMMLPASGMDELIQSMTVSRAADFGYRPTKGFSSFDPEAEDDEDFSSVEESVDESDE